MRGDRGSETAAADREAVVAPVVSDEIVAPIVSDEIVDPVDPDDFVALVDPEEEIVDAFPVLAEVRPLPASAPATAPVALPAVRAAAVAATGFVAGAATLALCRRLGARRLQRARVATGRGLDLPIVGSRTFLVDVHLIAKPEE